jgi:hypothetical protein
MGRLAMKVISVWQPWASLIILGHKFIETRGWPAPKSLIDETIGIAATSQLKAEQRIAMQDPEFKRYYDELDMPPLDALPYGAVIGTVRLHSCEVMTEEFMADVTGEEKAFGIWAPGRYAWRLRYPKAFERPVPVRGMQGVWNWNPDDQETPLQRPTREAAPSWARPALHLV